MNQLEPEDLAQLLMEKMSSLQRQVHAVLATGDHFHKDYGIPRNVINELLSSDQIPEAIRDRAHETLWLWQREVDQDVGKLAVVTQKKQPLATAIRI